MQYGTAPSTGYRLLSMFLDFVIMSICIWILFMIFILPSMPSPTDSFKPSHDSGPFMMFPTGVFALFGVIYAFFFCKDCINGRSLAKRIVGHQVINHKTGLPAGPWRCVVRNLFTIFWPIEVIVALANPGRRIGDFVAGTEVVEYEHVVEYNEQDEYVPPPKPKYLQALLSYMVVASVLAFLSYKWAKFIESMVHPEPQYVEASFNEDWSDDLQARYDADFGEMLTADVRAYDQSQDRSGKYVSVILNVNKPAILPEKQLYDSVVHIAKSTYPDDTVHGRVQYVVLAAPNTPVKQFIQNVWTF